MIEGLLRLALPRTEGSEGRPVLRVRMDLYKIGGCQSGPMMLGDVRGRMCIDDETHSDLSTLKSAAVLHWQEASIKVYMVFYEARSAV